MEIVTPPLKKEKEKEKKDDKKLYFKMHACAEKDV